MRHHEVDHRFSDTDPRTIRRQHDLTGLPLSTSILIFTFRSSRQFCVKHESRHAKPCCKYSRARIHMTDPSEIFRVDESAGGSELLPRHGRFRVCCSFHRSGHFHWVTSVPWLGNVACPDYLRFHINVVTIISRSSVHLAFHMYLKYLPLLRISGLPSDHDIHT